ncbi:hypothetical protein TURU_027799 [Turdus rufiventris]|nr:hypothetical protein TURU_027799 [Turdus rufiventris]
MNALASRGKLITEMSPGSPVLYQAVIKPVLEGIQESNLILGPRKPGSTIKMERSFIMGGLGSSAVTSFEMHNLVWSLWRQEISMTIYLDTGEIVLLQKRKNNSSEISGVIGTEVSKNIIPIEDLPSSEEFQHNGKLWSQKSFSFEGKCTIISTDATTKDYKSPLNRVIVFICAACSFEDSAYN